MSHKTYRIGGLCLRLEADEPIRDADFYPLFRAEGDTPDVTVRVLRQPLPEPEGTETPCTSRRRRVVSDGTAYDYTYFPDAKLKKPVAYACAARQGDRVTLWVDYNAPFWDTMLFDAMGLPDLLLERGDVIVHAAYIGMETDGILFAGPQNRGKTTQALLWQQYRNAAVINGDRAVLREMPQGFTVYGVPFCGSSRLCLNEQRPVRAVVFPEKGDDNLVTALSPFESFKRLIGCFSYTQADSAMQERAVRLAERVAESCPCLRLVCRPDAEAVETLARALGYGPSDESTTKNGNIIMNHI